MCRDMYVSMQICISVSILVLRITCVLDYKVKKGACIFVYKFTILPEHILTGLQILRSQRVRRGH